MHGLGGKLHCPFVNDLRWVEPPQVHAHYRGEVLRVHNHVVGEFHILRSDWGPVRPFGGRVDLYRNLLLVRGNTPGLRDQRLKFQGLVVHFHQRGIDQVKDLGSIDGVIDISIKRLGKLRGVQGQFIHFNGCGSGSHHKDFFGDKDIYGYGNYRQQDNEKQSFLILHAIPLHTEKGLQIFSTKAGKTLFKL